ncbi:MAG: phage tail protein [Candidatus Cloacimonadota bacterium]|nr:MAG: phage tail protein [Candidatus Cloacimonadota bacterium]
MRNFYSHEKIFYSFIVLWMLIGAVVLYAVNNNEVYSDSSWGRNKYNDGEVCDKNEDEVYLAKVRTLNEILTKLRDHYVDELDMEELLDAAIDGVLSKVDPHTDYFDEDELCLFMSSAQGEFGGLGISIDKIDDYITVISPIEGTPAYKMGIIAGDKLSKINGESIVGVSIEESIKKMRGPAGSKIVLTVERPGIGELDFEIQRDVIKIKSVPYAFKLDNGAGYIRIRQFNSHTAKEFAKALDDLENKGIKGLIIDLRSNPGGLLSQAIDTVNEFVGKDKCVVFTKGRSIEANQQYYTKYDRIREDYPVVVLINEASASASEIFAGSIQDWDRGLLVGKTSFGKGSVQNIEQLYSGGIKITTSKYYIHSGRCIHKELNDKILRGKEVSEKEREIIESENHKKEYFTENGRKVFGGGGVTPDVKVENDYLSDLGIKINQKNLFFSYSVDYFRDNKDKINEDFKLNDSLINDFYEYLAENGINYSETEKDSIADWIKINLEASIIEKKYGELAGYKKRLGTDLQFIAAKNLFEKYKTLDEMFKYAESLQKKDEEKR